MVEQLNPGVDSRETQNEPIAPTSDYETSDRSLMIFWSRNAGRGIMKEERDGLEQDIKSHPEWAGSEVHLYDEIIRVCPKTLAMDSVAHRFAVDFDPRNGFGRYAKIFTTCINNPPPGTQILTRESDGTINQSELELYPHWTAKEMIEEMARTAAIALPQSDITKLRLDIYKILR